MSGFVSLNMDDHMTGIFGLTGQPDKPFFSGNRHAAYLAFLCFAILQWVAASKGVAFGGQGVCVTVCVERSELERRFSRVSNAMADGWCFLGSKAKRNYWENYATDEERVRFGRARDALDRADRTEKEQGRPYWLVYNNARGDERKEAERQYKRFGEPLSRKKTAAELLEKEVRTAIEERVSREARNGFYNNINTEVAFGHITPGAAALLKLAYYYLEKDLDYKNNTITTRFFPRYHSPCRTLIEHIDSLARSAHGNSATGEGMENALSEMRSSLIELYLITEVPFSNKPVHLSGPISEEMSIHPKGEESNYSAEDMETMLRRYSLEAASVLMEIAVQMPGKWGDWR